MQTEALNNILSELNSFYENIKAEIILIELQKKIGVDKLDILTQNNGVFKRGFRRDVLKVNKTINKELLLNLSRLGIYDALPEGFFHKNRKSTLQSFSVERQARKAEERNSRLFFSPIENELFYQSVSINKKEKELLDGFYEINNDFLLNFWNLKKYINNKYVVQIVKLLPHCHKISGDLTLTKLYLENILDEKVEFIKKFKTHKFVTTKNNTLLGINFTVTSKNNNVSIPSLEVKIGPISNPKQNQYYKNKEITEFLELFYSYFLPLELKIKTSFFYDKKQKFILNKKETPVMGVSTKI